MAVRQAASVTLCKSGAVAAVTEYHFKAASTSAAPTRPTTKAPSAGWYAAVPTWATGTRLYVATRTDLVDGTFLWSDVTEDPTWATAGEAKAKADETEQYFYADSAGAHVVSALDSSGKAQGYRLDMDSAGLDVLDAKTLDVVASFGSAGVTLGGKAQARAKLTSAGMTVTDASSNALATFTGSGASFGGSSGARATVDSAGLHLKKGNATVADFGEEVVLSSAASAAAGETKGVLTLGARSLSMKSGLLAVAPTGSNAAVAGTASTGTFGAASENTLDANGLTHRALDASAKAAAHVRLGPNAATYESTRTPGVGSHMGPFTVFCDTYGIDADSRTDITQNPTFVRLETDRIVVRAGTGSVSFNSPISAGSVTATSAWATTVKTNAVSPRSGDDVTVTAGQLVVANATAKSTFGARVDPSDGSCGLYRNADSAGAAMAHWMVRETDSDLYLGCRRGSYKPYYTVGDSLTWSYINTAGFITSSSKNVRFVIPLAKPVLGVSSVTASSVNGCKIRQGSKYLFGSSGSADVKPSKYEAVSMNNCIRINMIFTSTTNVTNNDSCGVEWSGKVTFS